MSTISKDDRGWRILFHDPNGKRRTLRPGHATSRDVQAIDRHLKLMVDARIRGEAPPHNTSLWLADQPVGLRRKLARFGLANFAESKAETLQAFLDGYIASRPDVKDSTATVYRHTRRCLIEFFGADSLLADITFADATRWRQWLVTDQKLADATVRRRCSLARQFFGFAVDDLLITDNPFRKLKGIGVVSNRERDHFLTREDADKILAACPDAEWRLIFALARYGGLRTPSETLALRWADIDWPAGKMTVHSPKTARHAGKETRLVPLFPELRQELEEAFDPEAEYVISRYRDPGQNLRTQFERIVKRAGLEPWEKLFQNLRTTRQTELSEQHPAHVVCKWLGNSVRVADRHYLQVTEEHFAAAVGGVPRVPNVAQNGHARAGNPMKSGTRRSKNPEKTRLSSVSKNQKWAAQDSKG
jgi:integrase